jgi:hypothetical protein
MRILAQSVTLAVLTFLMVAFLAVAPTKAQETTDNAPATPTVQNLAATELPKPDQDVAATGKATVFIYRPKKLVGSALEPSVFCDGIELGRMDNGRFIVLKLEPGKHKLHMTDKTNGFNIEVKANEEIFARFKLVTGMWKGMGSIYLSNDEDALKELKKLKPLGKDKIKDETLVIGDEQEALAEVNKLLAPNRKSQAK